MFSFRRQRDHRQFSTGESWVTTGLVYPSFGVLVHDMSVGDPQPKTKFRNLTWQVGQDKRELGVLLFPDEESEAWRAAVAAAWAREGGGPIVGSTGGSVDGAITVQQQLKSDSWPVGMRQQLEQLLLSEVDRWVGAVLIEAVAAGGSA